ncbi:MAG: hypothetical protein QUV35_12975 [Hydrogenophaga sp.]|uniref:hypothetical protein n=1 Tax=Hydrogenophaga sp. TaxID=1904254 RepID=UPI00260DD1FA|nr:hypothetical protein [Hydrogenophaga sp.]MDM7943530.1 hypothetical protein [Hydrogenophaga sp.]
MKKLNCWTTWSCLLLTLCGPAAAQMFEVRDRVTMDVPKALFSSSPSAELKAEARKQAVDRAWRRYMAQNFSGARAQQAMDNEAALRSMADQFCSFNFADERFDKDAGQFSLEVRGSCDQRAIDAAFNRLFRTTTQQAGGGGRARGPLVGFVFLARRAAAETNERESALTLSTSATEGSSDNQQSGRRASAGSSTEQASVTQRANASTTTTDAVYRYEVEATDDAMTSVANSLQSNGFRVSRYPDLVTQCPGPSMGDLSKRYADMSVNTAWNPKDTKGMYDAARQCRLPYFAFGLMEVLKARQVGLSAFEVVVSLNVKVSDLSEPLAVECASMSKQFSGRGADRLEAARSALKITGEEGSRELIDIIRSNCL